MIGLQGPYPFSPVTQENYFSFCRSEDRGYFIANETTPLSFILGNPLSSVAQIGSSSIITKGPVVYSLRDQFGVALEKEFFVS
jgi:hypothetical protein